MASICREEGNILSRGAVIRFRVLIENRLNVQ